MCLCSTDVLIIWGNFQNFVCENPAKLLNQTNVNSQMYVLIPLENKHI